MPLPKGRVEPMTGLMPKMGRQLDVNFLKENKVKDD